VRVIRRGRLSVAQSVPGTVRRGHVNTVDQQQAAVVDAVVDLNVDLDDVNAALAALASRQQQHRVGRLEFTLPVGRRGGQVLVDGDFAADQVGQPVLVSLAPFDRRDEAEGVALTFVGEVVNRHQMRLHWSAAGPAPSRVAVHFLIGGSS
jgi:hypothetical protein